MLGRGEIGEADDGGISGSFDTGPGLFFVGFDFRQSLGCMFFLIVLDALIGEIHLLGVFPVGLKNFHQTVDEIGIAEADSQFPAFIEALRIDVEGTQEGSLFVRKDKLRMEMNAFEFMNVDSQILKQSKSRHPLEDVKLPE
jgi:hypothetical protein